MRDWKSNDKTHKADTLSMVFYPSTKMCVRFKVDSREKCSGELYFRLVAPFQFTDVSIEQYTVIIPVHRDRKNRRVPANWFLSFLNQRVIRTQKQSKMLGYGKCGF